MSTDRAIGAVGALPADLGSLAAPLHDCPRPLTVWTATGREPQVFLDTSGRRSQRVRVAGSLLAALSLTWLGALLLGPVGFETLPALPGTAIAAHHAHGHHRRPPVQMASASRIDASAAHAEARRELGMSNGTLR